MTKTEAAYIAGLIDGEGSLRIFLANQKRPNGDMYTVAHVRLHVGMTDRPIIEWLHSITGNGSIEIRTQPKHPNWKTCYVVRWSSGTATPLLKTIMPYLRLKKRHAEIAIEWFRLSKRGRKFVGGRGHTDRTLPYDIVERRAELLAEMKLLNRKGTLV